MNKKMDLVVYMKDKGFVYQSSSIYGGLANSWDYGPLGVLLKDNIVKLWKTFFIDSQENSFHIDSSIILNNDVWKSSGHLGKFSDKLVDCKNCKKRYKVEDLIHKVEDFSLNKNKIKCPNCGENNWGNSKDFNLMFPIEMSINNNKEKINYLRPETAQGVFINFKNIKDSFNPKLPFSVGQFGKAFRNEITPGNFIFRTKEFEQLELEIFIDPKDQETTMKETQNRIEEFLRKLNIKNDEFSKVNIDKNKLAHYSSQTIDYEYDFYFGKDEILGLANRTNFDLKNHSEMSGENLSITNDDGDEVFYPYVIEASFGINRLLLATIGSSLQIEQLENNTERIVLKLPYNLSPYKIVVLPLTKNQNEQAFKLYQKLLKLNIGPIYFDRTGSIGKRYRRADEKGTFFAITVDYDSMNDASFTIRNRDTMKTSRINLNNLTQYIVENGK